MTVLANTRGAWINQFAQPTKTQFLERANQVGYVVIKYGLPFYERLAMANNIPWVAEIMACDGVGDQLGPSRAAKYATKLAGQANQPGCIAAVINLEEADGGWHHDNGDGTRELVETFRELTGAKIPLFASLDTRGDRPLYPYQREAARHCQGVMPMIYPTAFQQPVERAMAVALNAKMMVTWQGKDVIPTIQTYGGILPGAILEMGRLHGLLYAAGKIAGLNGYTLGHASPLQWDTFLTSTAWLSMRPSTDVKVVSTDEGLRLLRKAWVDQWTAIAMRGTVDEAVALAAYWKKLVS